MYPPQSGQGAPRAFDYVVAGVGVRLRLLEDWNVVKTRGRCCVVVFVVFVFVQFVVDETHVDVVVVGQPLELDALQGLNSMVCLLGGIRVVVPAPRSLPLLWAAMVLIVGGGPVQR